MPESVHSSSLLVRALSLAACLVALASVAPAASAPDYSFFSLHQFSGQSGPDGSFPGGALVSDANGNLYGTTRVGGAHGVGSVFELVVNGEGNYTARVLYSFTAGNDGGFPLAGVVLDANGNLFGSAATGGVHGLGDVFELVNNGNGTYTESTLYSFAGGADGLNPEAPLVFDAHGNLFGTTSAQASPHDGSVFELVSNGNGTYTESTLYSFTGGADGSGPSGGLAIDANGNIFGTTFSGGSHHEGVIFELQGNGQGGYSERTVYTFTGGSDGSVPTAGVIIDANGNLYGTNSVGGPQGGGVAWELVNSGGGQYSFLTLYGFTGATVPGQNNPNPGGLVMDISGNFFGTTQYGGSSDDGTAFELVYSGTPGNYTQKVLRSFTGSADGSQPASGPLLMDASGNLFGITMAGTASFGGAVWEFSPPDATDASNTFYGNQVVNGRLTANSFSGNGANLTNVTAVALNCAGCITDAQLQNSYAAADAPSGNALNALALNGLSSTAFAITGAGGNTFAGPQIFSSTITANAALNGTSAGFSGPLSSSGFALSPAGSATASQGFNSTPLDLPASIYSSNTAAPENILFRWQAEPVAATNNTPNPAATLNLLYGPPASPSETGLSVNQDGTFNFAAGQTFPGTLASGSNPSFGTVTATSFNGGSFSGNGTALTGVQAAGLASAAMISGSQVSGPVGNAVTAANLTGNIAESQVTNLTADLANLANGAFVPLAGGTMTGALNLPTLNATGAVTSASAATSSLTIGGGTPITQYLSVTANITLPDVKGNSCATVETAAIAGFTPGAADTIALGLPVNFLSGLNDGKGAAIFLMFQAWETTGSPNTSITLQVCNPTGANYPPHKKSAATGTVRIDILKH
ncbi:MAG TPA: choice-of-anchor tandem repeat GloVer-containing protein [Terracidiphilus sp.]|nr:choice-of-anchor tandem repeat GloVer-containing protein [Terracidiphilus sp.]